MLAVSFAFRLVLSYVRKTDTIILLYHTIRWRDYAAVFSTSNRWVHSSITIEIYRKFTPASHSASPRPCHGVDSIGRLLHPAPLGACFCIALLLKSFFSHLKTSPSQETPRTYIPSTYVTSPRHIATSRHNHRTMMAELARLAASRVKTLLRNRDEGGWPDRRSKGLEDASSPCCRFLLVGQFAPGERIIEQTRAGER